MDKSLVCALLVFVCTGSAQECPENQTWRECSSACPPHCGDPPDQACPDVCLEPQCQCNDGFLLNSHDQCVMPEDCDHQEEDPVPVDNGQPGNENGNGNGNPTPPEEHICPENQSWRECSFACPPRCGDPPDMACPAVCLEPQCQCNEGFLLNSHDQCVTPEDCDHQEENPAENGNGNPEAQNRNPPAEEVRCPTNQSWYECSSPCPPRCDDPPDLACITLCLQPQCQCAQGFLLNSRGECVRPEDCDHEAVGDHSVQRRNSETTGNPESETRCAANETWNECGTHCEARCDQEDPVICTADCPGPPACKCADGFFRDPYNLQCVQREDCTQPPTCDNHECPEGEVCVLHQVFCVRAPCPPQPTCVPEDQAGNYCGRNEEWNRCGAQCEGRCDAINITECIDICNPGACACKQGFYRNSERQCVTEEQCVQDNPTVCGPNEEWNDCGAWCEGKCDSLDNTVCILICGPGACACQEGFYRNSVGDCVNRTDCKLDTPTTCENLDCRPGHVCRMEGGHPRCVRPMSRVPRSHFNFWKWGASRKRRTCRRHRCDEGEVCVLREVQCFVPPCYPIPECVSTNITEGCRKDEVFTECLPQCEPKCRGIDDCPDAEIQVCRAGCKCPIGQRRNGSGRCVRERECFRNPGCQDNEKYSRCIECENKCAEEDNRMCRRRFCSSGCACTRGYARDDNNQCVEESQCPSSTGEPTTENGETTVTGPTFETTVVNGQTTVTGPTFVTQQTTASGPIITEPVTVTEPTFVTDELTTVDE